MEKRIPLNLSVSWEHALYALILALAVFSRFWDLGAHAMSHDESLHALYSWKLYIGDGYRHDPMMHGPFLFHANALVYFLFGDDDFTARMFPALMGVFLVMSPLLMRRWFGRVGALLASFFLLISPITLYYSRYIRNDVYTCVWNMLMAAALFQYLHTRKARWLYIGAVAISLSLCTKEIAYIHGFIGLTFILTVMVWERTKGRGMVTAFYVVLALFVLGNLFVFWLAMANADVPPGTASGIPWKLVQALTMALGIVYAAVSMALFVDRSDRPMTGTVTTLPKNSLLIAVVLAAAVFVLLYTTFFTNPSGLWTGTGGALVYWLKQQAVQRGSQPWYYYLFLLLPLYEFLPYLFSIVGVIYYTARGIGVTRGGGKDASPGKGEKGEKEERLLFAGYIVYWTITALVIYSWAGEKMPWLTVHPAQPMILLTALFLNDFTARVDWKEVWRRGGVIFSLLIPLLLVAVASVLFSKPFQGQSVFDLQSTGQWIAGLIIMIGLAVGMVVYARWLRWGLAGRLAVVTVVVLLSLATIRFAWLASFVNYDYVNEYMFYAHGGPDVKFALNQIDDISRRTVGDRQIKVAYDSESTWPLEWYMRLYPNRAFYGEQPNRDALDAPVVIAHPDMSSKVEPFLGNNYRSFRYRLVWWPIETYKGQTPGKLWRTYMDPETGAEKRKELWNIIMYRKHENPLSEWPYRHDFIMYVRNDVATDVWSYQSGGQQGVEIEPDPYLEKHVDVTAEVLWGKAGAEEGRLSAPRDAAVGPDGLVYVADSGNNRVQVFTPGGDFVRGWGEGGNGPGQFNEPWGIAVAGDGTVYVADTWNHRVQVFDPQGEFLGMWGSMVDTNGLADGYEGMFWGPRDVAVDREGNLYVTDTGNKRVQKFTPQGDFLGQWGGFGVEPGQFNEPVGIAIDAEGRIYVADAWNRRIQKFSSGFEPLAQWPVEGWKSTAVPHKPYIAVDGEGRIFVTDPEAYRVLVFGPDGEILATFGQYGFDGMSFALPNGIAVDAEDNVYVVDSDNNRVMKFAPFGEQ